MTVKVHGTSSSNESLVGELDFYTVVVSDTIITDTGSVGDTDQDLYDNIIEVISQFAQPILLGPVTTNDTFKFAVEHSAIWTENPLATDSKAVSLKTAIETALQTPGPLGSETVAVTYAGTI